MSLIQPGACTSHTSTVLSCSDPDHRFQTPARTLSPLAGIVTDHLLVDTERQPSPALNSNNPFRNRTISPTIPSPSSPQFSVNGVMPDRPSSQSKNPFLDRTDEREMGGAQRRNMSPTEAAPVTNGRASPAKPIFSSNTAELLASLNLNDNTANASRQNTFPPGATKGTSRTENVPPVAGRPIPGAHRTSRSQDEEQQRHRGAGRARGATQELDIFADPSEISKSRPQRLRRNSDSSVADRHGKPLTEEERKRRERRHREREARHREHRDGKGRHPSSKSKKPGHRLDTIDKLDVTSIYGTGLFHHDGPFDACNPHRNRKGSQRAPMQAFPKDSANNALGGAGPVNKNIDIDQFHGTGAEGFTEFSTARAATEPDSYDPFPGAISRPTVDRAGSFNPTAKVEPLHGEESMGLGTSTFLEGAPAARSAIQRRESESEGQAPGGGLSRKMSLAKKLKGISNATRGPGGRITSPEPRYQPVTSPIEVQSGGGLPRLGQSNPFFSDYDKEYEKKGASIQVSETSPREDGPSSPNRVSNGLPRLQRRVTNDSTFGGGLGDTEQKIGGGGFLNRVKSLRGGRRTRPE